jgi:hypothetical protein
MSTRLIINRSTIRHNPNYGQQFYTVAGYPIHTLEVRGLTSDNAQDHIIKKLKALDWVMEICSNGTAQFVKFTGRMAADCDPYADVAAILAPFRLSYTTGHRQEHTQLHAVFPQPRFLYSYYPMQRECPCCGEVLELPENLVCDYLFCYNCDVPVGDECFDPERLTDAELETIAKENERTE